jgi:hypothetical protein
VRLSKLPQPNLNQLDLQLYNLSLDQFWVPPFNQWRWCSNSSLSFNSSLNSNSSRSTWTPTGIFWSPKGGVVVDVEVAVVEVVGEEGAINPINNPINSSLPTSSLPSNLSRTSNLSPSNLSSTSNRNPKLTSRL